MTAQPTPRTALAGSSTMGLGLAVAAAVVLPWIVDAYTISLASYGLVLGLLALSAHLLTTTVGLPSLGQAAYLGVGAYTAAIVGRSLTSDALVQLLTAAAVAAAAAGVIGAALVRTRGTVFMICSIAVGEVAYLAAERSTPLTGGGNGLPSAAVSLPTTAPLVLDGQLYLYVLACTLALAAGLGLLVRSRVGLIWRSVADHEQRMLANGYSAHFRLWQAYTVAGAVAGAAGALLTASRRFISPSDLSFSVGALALLAAIIGGRSLVAVIAAALLLVGLRDLVGGALAGDSPLLLGLVFVAAALVRSDPAGHLGRATARLRALWGRPR